MTILRILLLTLLGTTASLYSSDLAQNLACFYGHVATQTPAQLQERGLSPLAVNHVYYGLATLSSYHPRSGFSGIWSLTPATKREITQQLCGTMSYLTCQDTHGDHHEAYPSCFTAKKRAAQSMSSSLVWAALTRREADIKDVMEQYNRHSPSSNLMQKFTEFNSAAQ